LRVELDFLAFLERLVAAHLDRAVMREHVFAAPIGGNEAEAFLVAKPFHRTGGHSVSFPE